MFSDLVLQLKGQGEAILNTLSDVFSIPDGKADGRPENIFAFYFENVKIIKLHFPILLKAILRLSRHVTVSTCNVIKSLNTMYLT